METMNVAREEYVFLPDTWPEGKTQITWSFDSLASRIWGADL